MKALISVFKKEKVVEFAAALKRLGVEVVATEGTARVLSENGVAVTKVSEFTGFQELLGLGAGGGAGGGVGGGARGSAGGSGKVKTLHPRIHAAIATAEIGIVAVNLLPLEFSGEGVEREGVEREGVEPLEGMDIGGVALLRSGIKNFEEVAVVVNPARYDAVVEELAAAEEGRLSRATKLELAREASKYLLAYGAEIDKILRREKKDKYREEK
ncbi:MAG: hypothetical protein C4B55_00455 [Candidatus Methanophagaceae archaeon]|nr:MAG: hypothetical protein C4B55_00455 [Methanophagales archaeon]